MDISRRNLSFLLPLLAARAEGQDHPANLDSKIYHPDQSTELGGKPKKGGRIFYGAEHSGFQLEMHQTVLGPGVESHPPHKHAHEEIMIVLDGSLETYIEGKTEIAEKGSVIYYGANQMHRARNAGQAVARYYVLELRGHAF